jgi:hypothetical protein
MSTGCRLTIIGFVAPVLAHLIGLAYSEIFIFTAILSYPIMVIVSLLILFPLNRLFARARLSPITQLPIVSVCGSIGGYLVLLFLMSPQMVVPGLDSRLAIEYPVIGILAALCCWVLYNWGPLRVTNLRPNIAFEKDAPKAARPSI